MAALSLPAPNTDLAFSPTVKAFQARRGSRVAYERVETRGGWPSEVTPDLAAFIAERDSFYLATASASGQPYVQHRGGPKGFLRVLDSRTLGFADFRGNRQYITLGNLAENGRAFIFLMDYAHQARVKLWGRARVVEDNPALIARLMVAGYDAAPEQAVLFTIEAWNGNCRQHIPKLFAADDVAETMSGLRQRIAELEAEIGRLRQSSPTPSSPAAAARPGCAAP